NRTVSLRIPFCDEKSVRVEHRVAGADANPYLVMAAVLAGIHHGLTEEVSPGPMETGDAYLNGGGKNLPRHWHKSLSFFRNGTILPKYLGAEYHDVYERNRRFECDNFYRIVQPIEFEWYMRTV
ncbi:MAG: glutamine synthetase, partial [Alphaproteobacteria bacterium]|nr:glutamine synthetase [Alphaproteobacteria bacterium]